MFREIARYVRACKNCIVHKAEQQRPPRLLATDVTRLWQQVMIDLIGQLSRSSNDYTWLFNMQDHFTKWVQMRSLRKTTADVITKSFAEAIIYHHRLPRRSVSKQRDVPKSCSECWQA
ncbi:uncharacterized protein LOC105434119 [Pogonomyrmex barbatus]|uniref:Uncharacterized protein LOC105434119 n=1 Tax=Pogonomyrmex barbatus TaxID=144034 RepID=A0A6I9WUV3_9HYME|nr:uncharacterized protein LOC105434119 [Pogonomyrmex barbatus]